MNSTESLPLSTSEPEAELGMDLDPMRDFYFYSMSFVIPVGLVCNSLSFGVFLTSPTLRRTTTGHFLISLSAADFVFLVGALLLWTHTKPGSHSFPSATFMNSSWLACTSIYFIRYASKLASAWLVVAITLERFITVRFPLHVARISRPNRARLVILVIALAACSLCAFPFWTIGLRLFESKPYCLIVNRTVYEHWSMSVLRVGALLLPSVFIIALTSLIVSNLYRANALRARHQEGQQASAPIQRQLTVMLLAVAVTFLIMRLPYTIAYYINHYKRHFWKDLSEYDSNRFFAAAKITDIIATSNYCLNFFLYCVCGSAFRRRLRTLFSCPYQRRAGVAHGRLHPSLRTRTSLMASVDSTRSLNNSFKMMPRVVDRSGRLNPRHSSDLSSVANKYDIVEEDEGIVDGALL